MNIQEAKRALLIKSKDLSRANGVERRKSRSIRTQKKECWTPSSKRPTGNWRWIPSRGTGELPR